MHDSKPSPTQLQPRIHHFSELIAAPDIAERIRNFVNQGYRYFAPENTSRWEPCVDRLVDLPSFHKQLGDRGLIAIIYDPDNSSIPIACAATSPWDGGFDGGYSPDELDGGWEIKIVTTKEGWMGKGLAGKCVDALFAEVVRLERVDLSRVDADRKLRFWIQTVECVNGAFWRRKGWKDVRGTDHEAGWFGSKEGYRLLVMTKKVDIDT
ncbi:hypothetical protein T440DRAFT_464843 [Plenodomus tracheiphilus IPT5]|uniref:N-acetyltransferase domain-containing protein n=1 Tax=Plenodomus tracheiphilus IPT5 TaxID=1408161 RepID=A0A6A7BKP5_9PLEO|nr:hypothetical protein T440DRAFT_464843 [Plenodomus tracheiphilus IPT5]